jgi:hypothetical protein
MFHPFLEPVGEALISGLRMAPILFIILIGVEYFNHYYSEQLKHFVKRSHWFMPGIAAGLSLIPGCSFGIFFATLFATGVVSLGTLLAALIATSDEALYVFLPLGYNPLPILSIKFFLAVTVGFLTDLAFRNHRNWLFPAQENGEEFCCRHHHHSKSLSEMAIHALKHTLRIVAIVVFILSLVNVWIDGGGETAIKGFLVHSRAWQPLLAALVGALPSCSTSVIIATLLTKGMITFGAAIAGLSAANGEAILVLAAKGATRRQLTTVLGLLLSISILAGYLIDLAALFK